MTEFIAHRINSTNELNQIEIVNGVEIDLRDSTQGLHLSHDPFEQGECFQDYLEHYRHGTMIINVKSERIEHEILGKISEKNIKYFFLDSSFPMIKLLSDLGEKNIAVRFSEFEGLDTIKSMAGKVRWVWVDCFNKFPLDSKTYKVIKDIGYKICIVSPELQGHKDSIEHYANSMIENNIVPDAICSKIHNKKVWGKYFNLV